MFLLLALVALQPEPTGSVDSFSECMWSRFREEGLRKTLPAQFARVATSVCASEERAFKSGLTTTLIRQGQSQSAAASMAQQIAAELRHNIVIVYCSITAGERSMGENGR